MVKGTLYNGEESQMDSMTVEAGENDQERLVNSFESYENILFEQVLCFLRVV